MKLEGAQVIAADRMAVWNAINDPEVLKRCIAGCQEMNKTSPTQFDAIVKQKIGPVSATFKGEVHLSDINEGHSLRLDGEGKGGVAGMAKGGALVTLTDVEGGTQLAYDAEASVAGKLAQLGSRLIDGVAQKMINSFFSNFKDEVESGSSASAMVDVDQSGAQGAVMAATAGAAGAAGAAASAYASDAAQGVRDTVDAHTGALHDAAAERMLNPAIGANVGNIDMDDPEIGDIDVSSVDGGPIEGEVTAGFDAARAASASAGAEVSDNLASMSGSFDADAAVDQVEAHVGEAVDDAKAAAARVGDSVSATVDDVQSQAEAVADDGADASRAAMGGAAGVAAAAGAAVSGFAARAQDQFNETHDNVRERVATAGADIDEEKSWNDTKDHLNRAGSEVRETAEDVYDAAKARVEGDMDRAKSEWNDAKNNASEAYNEIKGAGEDAFTTAKGYAAEEAKAPKIGPLGQPWYLWIIGVIVLLVILWIL